MTTADRAPLTAGGLVARSNLYRPAQPARVVRRALTAAAELIARNDKSGQRRLKGMAWQHRAWELYDLIGEVHYAASFFGKNLGRVRMIVEQRDAQGEWAEIDKGPAFDAFERIRGPRGERTDLWRAYGEQMFMVGETILFGSLEGTEEVWEMLSSVEVEVLDTTIKRHVRHAGGPKEYQIAVAGQVLKEGEAQTYRLWRQHPRNSGDADAPMRAVMQLCEELLLLGDAVKARARSRIAGAGIFVVPEEATTRAARREGAGMDEDPEEDIFVADLTEAMTTPVGDPLAASAIVPLVIRVPGEHADKFKKISWADELTRYPETELRQEIIRRIAQGIDLPPELLLGMESANHWTAWLIDESTWTAHIEPVARQLAGDLTEAFLLPLLADLPNPDDFRVWYDPAGLTTKPDRFADAQQAHDRLVISDDPERALRIGVLMKDAGLALTGEVTKAPAPIINQPPAAPPPPPAGDPGTTDKGPPVQDAATAAAVRVAVARCREAAGARLLTRLQKEPAAARAKLRDVPRSAACAAVGAGVIGTLGLTPRALVAGAAAHLVDAGFPESLVELVEAHAAGTLFDNPPAGMSGS